MTGIGIKGMEWDEKGWNRAKRAGNGDKRDGMG